MVLDWRATGMRETRDALFLFRRKFNFDAKIEALPAATRLVYQDVGRALIRRGVFWGR
jgi:hypothetical protein